MISQRDIDAVQHIVFDSGAAAKFEDALRPNKAGRPATFPQGVFLAGMTLFTGVSWFGVMDRVGKEARERQLAPEFFTAKFVGGVPTGDGAGDSVRRHATAKRDAFGDAAPGVPVNGGGSRGRAAGVDGARRLAGHMDQPEGVTANRIHVGINHSDICRGGYHSLDRVAPLAQDGEGGLCRERMRRHGHAARAST